MASILKNDPSKYTVRNPVTTANAPVNTIGSTNVSTGAYAPPAPAPAPAPAPSPVANNAPVYGYGGANYNTSDAATRQTISQNEQRLNSDPAFVQSEIQRALQVINSRNQAGMDTSEQMAYLQRLGYNPQQQQAQSPTNFAQPLNQQYADWSNVMGASQYQQQQNAAQSVGNTMDIIQAQSGGGDTYTQQLYDNFMKAIEAMNNQNSQRWAQEQALAKEQAEKTAAERREQYQSLIDRLSANQQSELSNIDANLASAKQSLEDQTFQNWLASRQELANQGMATSGAMDAANTRLMLANNRNMSDLYTRNQNAITDIGNRYGQQLSEINRDMSRVSASDIENQLLQQMYQSGNQQLMEQAKLFSDMLGKTLPYDRFKPGELMDNFFRYDQLGAQDAWKFQDNYLERQKMDEQSRQFYAKLSTEDRQYFADLGFRYDQLDSQERRDFAKLDTDMQRFAAQLQKDYEIDLSKVMGVNPVTGEATLDARKLLAETELNWSKLSEQVRHNSVSESISRMNANTSATNAQTNIARLQEQMRQNDLQASMAFNQMQNGLWKDQASILHNEAQMRSKQINDLLGMLDQADAATKPMIQEQLRSASKMYDAAILNLTVAASNKPQYGYAPHGGDFIQ